MKNRSESHHEIWNHLIMIESNDYDDTRMIRLMRTSLKIVRVDMLQIVNA